MWNATVFIFSLSPFPGLNCKENICLLGSLSAIQADYTALNPCCHSLTSDWMQRWTSPSPSPGPYRILCTCLTRTDYSCVIRQVACCKRTGFLSREARLVFCVSFNAGVVRGRHFFFLFKERHLLCVTEGCVPVKCMRPQSVSLRFDPTGFWKANKQKCSI